MFEKKTILQILRGDVMNTHPFIVYRGPLAVTVRYQGYH